MTSTGRGGLVEIRLDRLPLRDWRISKLHHDALYREFFLIAEADPDDRGSVPGRLQRLVDENRDKFRSINPDLAPLLERASQEGKATVDVIVQLPPQALDVLQTLRTILAEADAYCHAGDLLTLDPPAEAVAFRDWFIDSVISQLEGGPAIPFTPTA